jgi:hypothetical protein
VHITSMFRFTHNIAARAISRKILSGLQRSNYWWDFNKTLELWSVSSPVVHNTSTFRLAA